MVTAAEHCVPDVLELLALQTREPFDEMGSVVGGFACGTVSIDRRPLRNRLLTFKRSANDHKRAVGGQIAGRGIERTQCCPEAYQAVCQRMTSRCGIRGSRTVLSCATRDPLRKALRRAGVRAIQNVHRLLCLRARWRGDVVLFTMD